MMLWHLTRCGQFSKGLIFPLYEKCIFPLMKKSVFSKANIETIFTLKLSFLAASLQLDPCACKALPCLVNDPRIFHCFTRIF